MNAELKQKIQKHFENKTFIKLTFSDKRNKKQDLSKVLVKPVRLKKGHQLSFVFRHKTKDITKNFSIKESINQIEALISKDFKQALLLTTLENVHYAAVGKTKLTISPASLTEAPLLEHDKKKKRLINPEHNTYLKELGITNSEGKVKSDKQDKYRQINKYIEILKGTIEKLKGQTPLRIVDMGAGKGYLTFALHDYVTNALKMEAQTTGVECRPELVSANNTIAQKAGFHHLRFMEGRIREVELPRFDVLIALHACDTATDDAIERGIRANAELIVCSPCCHKQIRQAMSKNEATKSITKHGILKERQAEILTDAIRALYLEAYGYKTQVFEFISTSHTPKNIIITALKEHNLREKTPIAEKLNEIKRLKTLFSIEKHYLEDYLS